MAKNRATFCRLDTIIEGAYCSIMRITIELTPDIENWLNGKVQSGSIASPDAYIQAAVQRDYLEEQLQESMLEPATPLTAEDWSNVRREVAKASDRRK
jgi:Arc/MetJ-type ribon-helix-helix transcriptional regulator